MGRRIHVKRLAAITGVAALALSPSALAAGALHGSYRTQIASGQLKGTWTVTFAKKSTYTVRGPLGKAAGKNTFAGTKITFGHETGASACSTTGKYTFKLTGKTLKLTKVSDACAPRATILTHKLVKVG
jgi:hypothetical protein